jgi:hypothetical protein
MFNPNMSSLQAKQQQERGASNDTFKAPPVLLRDVNPQWTLLIISRCVNR